MADTAADVTRSSADTFQIELERSDSTWTIVKLLLMPLASLKLTVALFAMAIFIVFAGTLAQVEKDIWEAINGYFRTPIAWIELQIFFPPSFFPSKPKVPGGFYFPGGWLIGLLMVINLLAAHGLRFKVQASGTRLVTGFIVIAVGVIVTWLVVVSGSNPDGWQQEPWIKWSTLWSLLKVGVAALWFASLYAWLRLMRKPGTERWVRTLAGLAPSLLGTLLGWLLYEGDAVRLGDSGMRILWQLIKGALAGVVLLSGCAMVFKKRAGIVLLHSGILLMMFNELLVGTMAQEAQMHIREGETVSYVQDIRKVELAIIDRSNPEHDDVVVVPQSFLLRGEPIQHELLPCSVEVLKYFKHSALHSADSSDENLADTAAGIRHVAVEARPGAGTDVGRDVDLASAYVKFTKRDGEPLGIYLVSQYLDDQPLQVDGKSYDVSLRFKQTPKSYSIQLLDVRKDDYLGTDTVRNYSSDVRLVDETRNVDRTIKIWMNNPLRYAGETLYQSNYSADPKTGVETTGLQVVTNTGWMIPYVACMIVATGMLAHFSIILLRFLNRRIAEQELQRAEAPRANRAKKGKNVEQSRPAPTDWADLAVRYLPVIVLAVVAVWLGSKFRLPKTGAGEMNVYEFGKLPLVEQGRVKPFDTLARNTLRVISDKQTFTDEQGQKQPAIRWLLDMIARPEIADKHQVIRIENMEVLDTLGLERRAGLRYALDEIRPKAEEFNLQVERARKLDPKDLSLYQRKMLELDRRIRTYTLVQGSFQTLPFPPLPTEEEFKKDREATTQRLMQIKQLLEAAVRFDEMLASMKPPLAVPVKSADSGAGKKNWQAYATAWTEAYRRRILGDEPNPATKSLNAIFAGYADGDPAAFNNAVARYQASILAKPPVVEPATGETLNVPKTNFEAFFNHLEPFFRSAVLYLVAFVLACIGWLGWSRPLNRAAFWLSALTLAFHTFALISRIYISGRPPVTNLYSSAVFIGWGCVVLGLVLEAVYRLGIGNVVAGVAGFNTLIIAHILAGDGDTFTMLQAVLDTQFWLATHVVCITLGYATTFVAGLLGVLYVIGGVMSPTLSPDRAKSLTRMIYGIVCFALFFSFVGTVLGGLWADDSWGRFWGWDPKENGALIIVLWNVLVLHARWGGMVKDRGLALLAVAGNIATSWSWFGVNELGVGLHSYGFTQGVLLALGLFIASQLAIIALGTMPERMWWSFKNGQESSESPA